MVTKLGSRSASMAALSIILEHMDCQDYTQSPDDAVVLTKEWISSPSLSQPPLLILPKDRLSRLPPSLKPVIRNKLSDKEISEQFVCDSGISCSDT